MKLLNVNSALLLESILYRRFVKLLTSSQLFYNTSLFEFSLEFLQRFLNVLAFFYRYYNHFVFNLLIVNSFFRKIRAQNYTYFLEQQNFQVLIIIFYRKKHHSTHRAIYINVRAREGGSIRKVSRQGTKKKRPTENTASLSLSHLYLNYKLGFNVDHSSTAGMIPNEIISSRITCK